MSRLVEFIAVENTSCISDKENYVNKIFDQLVADGFISTIAVVPGASMGSAVSVCDEEETCFSIDYNSVVNSSCNVWNLFFQFGTYDDRLHFKICISSNTYTVSVEDDYLEKLKLKIKQIIFDDWKDVIWLTDEDSQCLSERIYPDLYRVENSLRRLINSVMIKVYGTTWWDVFVPFSIKNKHRSRLGGYKSVVPGFNNVDEKLMSIDVGDLFSIITLERKKWNPKFDDEISSQLSGMIPEKPEKIIELLKKQLEKEISLWDKWFSKYLSESFESNFKMFEKYRNHIAHNKLIDRSAYRKIKDVTKNISDDIKEAIDKSEKDILSAEDRAMVEREKEEFLQMMEECEHENKENDAGVCIRTDDEIYDMLSYAVGEVISFLSENLCFREDIEIQTGKYYEDGQSAFEVVSKITEEKIDITVEFEVCDDEGVESLVTLQYGEEYSIIRYMNGEVEYDSDQGLYMPITQDELSQKDIEETKEKILEYINEITDIKGKAHSACYAAQKDGGNPPMVDYVDCEECGEFEITIDDEFAPVGTCLNCGCKNNISECDRCGSWFNTNLEGEFIEGEISICQNCLEDIENE